MAPPTHPERRRRELGADDGRAAPEPGRALHGHAFEESEPLERPAGPRHGGQ